jgi:hypothetical protein
MPIGVPPGTYVVEGPVNDANGVADADVRYAITQLPSNTLSLANIGLLFSYATLATASNNCRASGFVQSFISRGT